MLLMLLAFWAAMGRATPAAHGQTQKKPLTEYEFKAGLIYNLIKYTDWPEEKKQEEQEKGDQKPKKDFVIGVVGEDPFGKNWKIIENKKVHDRKIVIKKYGEFAKIKPTKDNTTFYSYEDLKKCQVLFISKSEEKNYQKIINVVKKESILTISETKGFLEKGGIVNFLLEKNKVSFEINLDAAKLAKLQIKTTVLKLAKRVLQKKKV